MILHLLRHFLADERGITAIEYAMIAGLVSTLIIGSLISIGTKLSGTYFSAVVGNLK